MTGYEHEAVNVKPEGGAMTVRLDPDVRITISSEESQNGVEQRMPYDRSHRLNVLRQRAANYVDAALENITREYPHVPFFIATSPESYQSHRVYHPAFYGSFDWHSCVEMHWVIARLLRLFPDDVPEDQARRTLDSLLTADNLATEAEFFSNPSHRSLERPYGSGWLLTLHHELAAWDDPDAQRWTTNLEPLVEVLIGNLVGWLRILTYPHRIGVHPNTAFGLSRCYPTAQRRAEQGDDALLTTIREVSLRWFQDDVDYPAHYEPSGADFLSPALTEAELMSRLLPPAEFPDWLGRFLPGLAESQPTRIFEPAIVADSTDGHIGHLYGLNLSRAWAFTQLAERLPEGDSRVSPLMSAAERHAAQALPHVTGSDYMIEHWLAAYATLLLG